MKILARDLFLEGEMEDIIEDGHEGSASSLSGEKVVLLRRLLT